MQWESVGKRWDCLGLVGGRATQWVGQPQMAPPQALLPLDNWYAGPGVAPVCSPEVLFGLVCHLVLGSLYLSLICQKCLFTWTWGLNWFVVWPSNSCALIQCFEVYIYLCLSMVFLRMQTWSPENSDSPKLVEMISIKLLSLVWCLFCHCYLQELTVGFGT